MKTELKDWLNSINQSKVNLIDEDPSIERDYPPYIINRCMSGHIDTVMYSNELNRTPNLSKKLQYDFLINIVRKRKRFSPWIKKEKIEDLECVKKYYDYSTEKAKQALNILTEEQLQFIKKKFETGGMR